MVNSIYIIVQEEGAWSDKEWKIVGVYDNLDQAQKNGWLALINEALIPWRLEFYQKNEEQEFPNSKGVSDYHIEEWDPINSVQKAVWYIGYNYDKRYSNKFDDHLKEIKSSCDNILKEWHSMIVEHNTLPPFLLNMTYMEK